MTDTMDTEKLIGELTAKTLNNCGVAERAVRLFEHFDLAKSIADNAEELSVMDKWELRDFFEDITLDWRDRNPDMVYPIVDALTGINGDYPPSGFTYLAELMIIYYNNR